MSREETANKENVKKRGRIDLPFLVLVILLLSFGLIMVFSASYARPLTITATAIVLSGNAAGRRGASGHGSHRDGDYKAAQFPSL
jgi:cell division protein FtsW (lipid II flippase)